MRVSAMIPTRNEASALAHVLADIPAGLVTEVLVVDSNSTEGTPEVAARMGARVIAEARRGYGRVCLTGIGQCCSTDVIVFRDGDYSDRPAELPRLLAPIADGRADITIGSHLAGPRARGAMAWHAAFGNRLAAFLIRILFRQKITGLGPFRAVRAGVVRELALEETTYGWAVEIILKGATQGFRVVEVPVELPSKDRRIEDQRHGPGHDRRRVVHLQPDSALLFAAAPGRYSRSGVRSDGTREREPHRGTGRRQNPGDHGQSGEIGRSEKPTGGMPLSRYNYGTVPLFFGGHDSPGAVARSSDGRHHVPCRRCRGTGPFGERQYASGSAGGIGLAASLESVFRSFSAQGWHRVIAFHTDTPHLPAAALRQAFDALGSCDVVVGPTHDGGYYLVGATVPHSGLFAASAMGTATGGTAPRAAESTAHSGVAEGT